MTSMEDPVKKPTKKWTGLSPHRLKDNDLERKLAQTQSRALESLA